MDSKLNASFMISEALKNIEKKGKNTPDDDTEEKSSSGEPQKGRAIVLAKK
jgi:hypothetical protein